ncbi:arabinogalactan endo-1,4-beta-galactosidase [Marivirga atlantica]|jgi:arabinogalactan endo-1,4-beta-galactosidase|uniref:Arabinogalactan endo-beta-1,4-galactanase n=1 Tax=Marivirga atlantica TaxID=1548457 RepID=A0A937A8F2_9BACT|nr:glycosyl hydrolase 53 family protein [Marivirga atlantica]MBL0765505.1 glycosyl hydrolase 53 family protein [Marivirga atlantica]
MKNIFYSLFFIGLFSCACSSEDDDIQTGPRENEEELILDDSFYLGADLSYVNEMEDCGAIYKNREGVEEDPYKIFADAGTGLVRLRLWYDPDWTDYSTLQDVKKSIRRAKELNMKIMLDFHYSDTWADPSRQLIPAEWRPHINDTQKLGELLYDYTYQTLNDLKSSQLLPDFVQVGNEINPMILQEEELEWPIDWERNAFLINKGIQAVRKVSNEADADIQLMLHIAQPENALWWFEQATANGVTDFDWIGLSYYPIWSEYELENVNEPIKTLVDTYNKKLMVVETAYPFTFENADAANNILNNDALVQGIPASPEGQLEYLNTLSEKIQAGGGSGLIYWEPAWVSTTCSTQWGQGSHWDNATMFDHNNQATIALDFYNSQND